MRKGSGHLVHPKSPIDWYLVPSMILHLVQRGPLYPSCQTVGLLSSSTKPPSHASLSNHSIILVEFADFLQYPEFTCTVAPPSHTASSIHCSHSVLFHRKEYVPAEHLLQTPSSNCSPGWQSLKSTVIKFSEIFSPNTVSIIS